MAMLKFKKGLWSKLPETKVEGTIYVTTDEKAMYLDISNSERIRLGDIIRVKTFNELQPPFSNEAFYYVEASNALLKRVAVTGENSEVTYEWKQINSTQELADRITVVEGKVATNKSDIGTLKTDVSTLKTDVSGLKTTVGSSTSGLVKDVADLQAAIGMGEGGASGSIGGTVSQLVKDLDALEGTVGTQGNTISEHTNKISDLETESAKHATKTELNNAKSAILGQTDGVDYNGTVKGAYEAAAAAQTQADKGVTDAATAQTKADANEQAISGLTSRVDTLTGAATVPGSVAEAKKAGDDALALIGNADSGLTKTVNSHTAALEILRGADTVDGSVANAKKVGTAAANQAETNRQNIASLTATVNKLNGDVDTDGSVKKQIKDATDAVKTELSAEIDADIRAANAMEYAGTINSDSDIPTTGVKNGATYVIGTSFGSYAAGDMLIAQGTENPDTGLIAKPNWAHVKSGYDASLDQQLTGANNKIMLSNGVRNDEDAAGAITFAATGSASVAVADNTVTIGMVWEDFN